MKIITYSNGMYDSNSYVIVGKDKKAVLIDAGASADFYLGESIKKGYNIEYLLLTHGHFDHTIGAYGLQKAGVKVLASEKDLDFFTNKNTLARALGVKVNDFVPDMFVKESQKLNICGFEITVIETAGHSKGSVCYLINDKLFSGDTLFLNSIGRTDLSGGNYNEIIKSIKTKILTLNNDTTVYSGHGDSTTIRDEKKSNPFISGAK